MGVMQYVCLAGAQAIKIYCFEHPPQKKNLINRLGASGNISS